MQFPTYENFCSNYVIADKIQHINNMLSYNIAVISQLENVHDWMTQRVNKLIDINQKIVEELAVTKGQKVAEHQILEDSAPEERIMESIFQRKCYKFKLTLKRSLKSPLYKDRNFNLFLGLFDMDNYPVNNRKTHLNQANSIPLRIDVYTSGSKPQLIESNKLGFSMIKGNTSTDLLEGNATFSKLSIREVSSKYERGLVTIVVSAMPPPFQCQKDCDIDYREVRPLLIRDVQIRAKKLH